MHPACAPQFEVAYVTGATREGHKSLATHPSLGCESSSLSQGAEPMVTRAKSRRVSPGQGLLDGGERGISDCHPPMAPEDVDHHGEAWVEIEANDLIRFLVRSYWKLVNN